MRLGRATTGATRATTGVSGLPTFQQLVGAPVSASRTPFAVLSANPKQRRRNDDRRLTTVFDPPPFNLDEGRTLVARPSPPSPSAYPAGPSAAGHELLPLVTRERNHLLSLLHVALYAAEPHPPSVWLALTHLIQYPAVRPLLPRAFHPTPDRSLSADDWDNGERLMDTRTPIALSLPELRRAFTLLARVRPPTRAGLSKLLVLVELLAMRSSASLPDVSELDAELTGARDAPRGDLRGSGTGLRAQDWAALILFASTCFRAPRPTHEINTMTSLFSQWTRNHRAPNGQILKPSRGVYNNLLFAAHKARNTTLYEAIQERMKQEGVSDDSYTQRIRMGVEADKGAHMDVIWTHFLTAVQVCLDSHEKGAEMDMERMSESNRKEWLGLWNQMLWTYAKRGLLTEAMRMYQAMRGGVGIDLRAVGPIKEDEPLDRHGQRIGTDDVYKIVPPSPQVEAYGSIIQALAHAGDLKGALSVLKDMTTPRPPPSPPSSSTASLPLDATHPRRLPPPPLPPTIHIYNSLFRGFATHGRTPPNSPFATRTPVLFTDLRIGANRSPTPSLQHYETLRRFVAPYDRRSSAIDEGGAEESLAWSLTALEALLHAFLALTPPPLPSSRSGLGRGVRLKSDTHAGERTAPSSRTLWWILLAVDKLSGGDTARGLRAWTALEEKFGEGKGEGWTGWRVDGRMQRVVERLWKRREEERLEEERVRAEEEEEQG